MIRQLIFSSSQPGAGGGDDDDADGNEERRRPLPGALKMMSIRRLIG
jgi:hypothetical protein